MRSHHDGLREDGLPIPRPAALCEYVSKPRPPKGAEIGLVEQTG
jgi:hypothetical protein